MTDGTPGSEEKEEVLHAGADIHTAAPLRSQCRSRCTCPEGSGSPQKAHTGAEEKGEEEGAAERNCHVLIATLFLIASAVLGRVGRGQGVRNGAITLNLGEKGMDEVSFLFVFQHLHIF